jgi:hypothetical protein
MTTLPPAECDRASWASYPSHFLPVDVHLKSYFNTYSIDQLIDRGLPGAFWLLLSALDLSDSTSISSAGLLRRRPYLHVLQPVRTLGPHFLLLLSALPVIMSEQSAAFSDKFCFNRRLSLHYQPADSGCA